MWKFYRGRNAFAKIFRGWGMIETPSRIKISYHTKSHRYALRVPGRKQLIRMALKGLLLITIILATTTIIANMRVNSLESYKTTADGEISTLKRQLYEMHEQIMWVQASDDLYLTGPGKVKSQIQRSAKLHGVDPEKALAIAECESGYKPLAKNNNSTAVGVYQFLESTWEWIGSPGNRYDARDNIEAFMVYYPKYPEWWSECN